MEKKKDVKIVSNKDLTALKVVTPIPFPQPIGPERNLKASVKKTVKK